MIFTLLPRRFAVHPFSLPRGGRGSCIEGLRIAVREEAGTPKTPDPEGGQTNSHTGGAGVDGGMRAREGMPDRHKIGPLKVDVRPSAEDVSAE